MNVADEAILGGTPQATPGQARSYLRWQPGRVLDEAAIRAIVAGCVGGGRRLGIRWDAALAAQCHETAGFTFPGQVPVGRKNVGGIGATNDGAPGLQNDSWATAERQWWAHLVAWLGGPDVVPTIGDWYTVALDPRLPAVAAARREKGVATTWASLGGRWAVPTDHPWREEGSGYGAGIARHLAAILRAPDDGSDDAGTDVPRTREERTMATPRIALSAGHWNRDGGSEIEKGQTIRLMRAAAVACRARGLRVYTLNPEAGDPMYAGGLWDEAHQIVAEHRRDPFALWCELHTEGAGPTARGIFAIYPDMGGDVDADVRDTLGPALARAVAAATGLPLRGDGLMPEHRTGVGLTGARLGIFGQSATVRATLTRCILEVGSHDAPEDLAISARPDFYPQFGEAFARAVAAWLPVGIPPQPAPDPPGPPLGPAEPDVWTAPTGYTLRGEFKRRYAAQPDAVALWGYPIGAEERQGGRLVQWFERARFEYDPATGAFALGLVGSEARHQPERAA